jgi:hypothetical protein
MGQVPGVAHLPLQNEHESENRGTYSEGNAGSGDTQELKFARQPY